MRKINFKINETVDWRFTFKVIWLRIRREFLIRFRSNYVLNNLKNRKTVSCADCKKGSCCKEFLDKLPFFSCEHLKENGKCDIYNSKEYPLACFISPVDSKDKWTDGCVIREKLERVNI